MTTDKQKSVWKKARTKYYNKNKRKCIKCIDKSRDKKKNSKYNTKKFKRLYNTDTEFKKRRKLRAKDNYYTLKVSCEKCGSKEYLEIHHPEYKEETKVKVLCRKCHRTLGGVHFGN